MSPVRRPSKAVVLCFSATLGLIKSPEHIHTYCITPLSIWNAASAGVQPDEIVEASKVWVFGAPCY